MKNRLRKAIRGIRHIRAVRVFLFAAISSSALAATVKIELPPETAMLKKAPGSDLVTAQCVVCHSVEYITTQPTLPRTYWQGAVTKMQQKFGAPVAAENVEAIVDYLVKNYGAEKPAAVK